MTTKWRPNKDGDNIYTIGDIHGQLHQLKLILKSILPLRKNEGVQDRIIFLGDYVDRNKNSHLVLDLLIDLKKKYKSKLMFLKGNHEDMFMSALLLGQAFPSKYDFWFANGGMQTLIGYLERRNLPINEPHRLPRSRLKDLVPQEHIDFLQNDLVNYCETDMLASATNNHRIFVHGGADPAIPLSQQDKETFWWNRSLINFCQKCKTDNTELPWTQEIYTGHNTDMSGKPFILKNKTNSGSFFMIDISATEQLICMEVNTKEMVKAQKGVSRLVKI